ncbi:MAG: hypothetical protein JJT75_01400 [Opitutales bacterium]|nr:hypothetical protein [Opitutales bacterium]MCH8541629.1 hypothetical protein [Opitutales bacterium]
MTAGIDTDFLVRLCLREHPGRPSAVAARDRHADQGGNFALAPQVLTEFIHVVTDARRFEKPLPIESALTMAQAYWDASDIVHTVPSNHAESLFFTLMRQHRLGRKRLLDTMLAATYISAGITHLFTGNPSDYRLFPELTLIEI